MDLRVGIFLLICFTVRVKSEIVSYEIIPGDGSDSEIRAYKMEYMTPFGYIRGSNRYYDKRGSLINYVDYIKTPSGIQIINARLQSLNEEYKGPFTPTSIPFNVQQGGANLNPQLIALLQQQQQEALLQGLNPQQSGLLLQQQQQQQQAALLQQQQQAALLQQQQQAAFLQQQQQQQQTPGLQQGSNPQVALILQNPQAVAILQSLSPQQVAVILQSPQAALIMQNLIQQQQAASILQSPQSGQLFQSQNPTLQLQGGQVPFGGIQNAGIQGPVQGFQRPVQNFQRPVQNFQGSFQDPNQIIVRQDFSNPQIFQYNPGFQTTGFYPFVQTVQTYPTPIFQGQPFNQQNQQFGTYPGGTQGFGSNKFSVNDNQLAINYLNEKHSRLPRHPFKMTNYSEDESNPNFSVYGGSRQLFQVEGNQSTDQTEKDIENEAFSY